MPKYIESSDQMAVIRYFDMQYPKLSPLLIHVPNGVHANAVVGSRLKKMGQRTGFPDLVLFYRTDEYDGLMIEMKTLKGKLSDHQKFYADFLNRNGYLCETARSFDDAKHIIDRYLDEK